MKIKLIITVFVVSFSTIQAQNELLIEANDSIKIYETYIAVNSKNNVFPKFYKNGLLYASTEKNEKTTLFYSDLKSPPVKIKNTSKVQLGAVALYNDDIYFTGTNKKISSNGFNNFAIYKAKLLDFKISKSKQLIFCNKEFKYTDPAISKNGDELLVVSNEKGVPHILKLTKTSNGEWVKNQIIFIAQPGFTIVNPYFFDENTIYFSYDFGEAEISHINANRKQGKFKIDEIHYASKSSFNLYKIVCKKGKWQLPVKVDKLNSEFDEFGLLFTSEITGFLNTFRYNNTDNIYYFEIIK